MVVPVMSAAPRAMSTTRENSAHISSSVAARDQVTCAGAGLHDVRRDPSGFGDGIMYPRAGGHVFTQIVDTNIHEFDGIERAAAEVRRNSGVGRSSAKDELRLDAGQGERCRHSGERPGCQQMAISTSSKTPPVP